MPAKNRVKQYADELIQHVYNRGVNKEPIFLDAQDHRVFLSYMATYLLPKNEKALTDILLDPEAGYRQKEEAKHLLQLKNFHGRVKLLAHKLMSNHFHFVLWQQGSHDIHAFIHALMTRYSAYLNRKYKRVGGLCQDIYKAVNVESDEQLLYLTRYVHRNGWSHERLVRARLEEYSSYPNYLGKIQQAWVHPEIILAYFRHGAAAYRSFVESIDSDLDEQEAGIIENLIEELE